MKSFATALAVAALAAVAHARAPNLPQQWACDLVQTMVMNEGGEQTGGGTVCCPLESPQCKVQTGFSAGKQYFDLPHNRTANKMPDGSGVVTLFNLGKEFAVDSDGNCQSYCPTSTVMYPFGIPSAATDMGATTYNGHACEDYRTTQKFPVLNVTMQQTDYYVALSASGGFDTPIANVQLLTPFGQRVGQQTVQFNNFQAGASTVPASAFTVNGIAKCPLNSKCQGNGGSSSSGGGGGGGGGCGGGGGGSPTSTSSAAEKDVVEIDMARSLLGETLEERIEAMASYHIPFGYSAPSALHPRPRIEE